MALIIAIALFAGLLIPYLVEEIHRGKIELGPRFPPGAGDIRPGYRGNPAPGQPLPRVAPDSAALSLRSFHIAFISLSVVLAAGTGVLGLLNHQILLGVLSLGIAILLIIYASYFLKKAET